MFGDLKQKYFLENYLFYTKNKQNQILIGFDFSKIHSLEKNKDYNCIFIQALKNNGFDNLNLSQTAFYQLENQRFSGNAMRILNIFATYVESSGSKVFYTRFATYLNMLSNFDNTDNIEEIKRKYSNFNELMLIANESAKYIIAELRTPQGDLKRGGFIYNINNPFHKQLFGELKAIEDAKQINANINDIQLVSQYVRDTANADKVITPEEQKVIDAMERIAKKQSTPSPKSPIGWILGSIGVITIIGIIIFIIKNKKRK
jgi:hypothetical protein